MAHSASRRRRNGALSGLVLTVAALGVAGCSGAPAASGGAAGGGSGLTIHADGVVLADGVKQMDAAARTEALTQVREDGTLVFKPGTEAASGLKAGDVLVVEGVAARKVTSVTAGASGVEVATEDATFGDVVKDGKLGWHWGVDFMALPDPAYQFATAGGLQRVQVASAGGADPAQLRQMAVAGTAMRFAGKVSGFDVELKLTPKPGQLDVELSASRANVKVQAAGFITNFVQETNMEFDDGEGKLFETTINGLKGEAEVTWNAFQVNDPSLDSDIVALEIPFSAPVPAMIGPIPVTINLKANVRVVPELTSGNASAGGSWKVTYNSDHGFTTNGGDPTPISKLQAMEANLGKEPTVTAGLGVTGMGVGFEWPRVELQLGHPINEVMLAQVAGGEDLYKKASALLRPYAFLTLNTYVNGLWTPGTTLSGDIPPCQRSSVKVSAIAGYKLSVLGMAELSSNKLLWEKSYDKFKDDKPCTLTGE